MGTANASPQIPEHLSPQQKKTLRQRLHLTPESKAGRLFRYIFGRPLATAETKTQKVGPVQGVPILGLDALGSASYGPEAALAVLPPLGALGLAYVREVIAAIICLLGILYFSYRQTIAAYPNGGGSFTVALVIIIVAKFQEGAWMTLLVIPGFVWIFLAVKGHYSHTSREIAGAPDLQLRDIRPLVVVIPIDGWSRVTEQAVRFAVQISSDVTALHVTSNEDNETLRNLWAERVERPSREAGLKTPRLDIVYSPFRQLFQPILDFVDAAKEEHPEQLVAVVVPELVQPRWWEYVLYNHTAAGLKAALLLHARSMWL